MKSIKSKFAYFSFALSLISGVAATESKAAVILFSTPDVIGPIITGGAGIYFAIEGIDDLSNGNKKGAARDFGISAILLVLDVDGSLPKDKISSYLETRYGSFIKNNKVFGDLADKIKSKAQSVDAVNGKKTISVTRQELDQIVKSVDLTGYENEYEKMAKDLE